uniref:Uncharacterized protein n=1 Tax=Anguilla anguilla TaxID=7936 RepID=A0A0E9VJ34_ANGAN
MDTQTNTTDHCEFREEVGNQYCHLNTSIILLIHHFSTCAYSDH